MCQRMRVSRTEWLVHSLWPYQQRVQKLEIDETLQQEHPRKKAPAKKVRDEQRQLGSNVLKHRQ